MGLIDTSQFLMSCIFTGYQGKFVWETGLLVKSPRCLIVDITWELHAIVDIIDSLKILKHTTCLHLTVESSWVPTLMIKLIEFIRLTFQLRSCLLDEVIIFDRIGNRHYFVNPLITRMAINILPYLIISSFFVNNGI